MANQKMTDSQYQKERGKFNNFLVAGACFVTIAFAISLSTLAIIIWSSHEVGNVADMSSALTKLADNVNQDPIVDILPQYQNQCPSGYKVANLGYWAGTSDGCFCADKNRLSRGHCGWANTGRKEQDKNRYHNNQQYPRRDLADVTANLDDSDQEMYNKMNKKKDQKYDQNFQQKPQQAQQNTHQSQQGSNQIPNTQQPSQNQRAQDEAMERAKQQYQTGNRQAGYQTQQQQQPVYQQQPPQYQQQQQGGYQSQQQGGYQYQQGGYQNQQQGGQQSNQYSQRTYYDSVDHSSGADFHGTDSSRSHHTSHCQNITSNYGHSMSSWAGSNWCVRRAAKDKEWVRASPCPQGFIECAPGLCFDHAVGCPVTSVAFSTMASPDAINFGRKNMILSKQSHGLDPVIDFKGSYFQNACFDNLKKPIEDPFKTYTHPLKNEQPGTGGCGKYGMDKDFSYIVDSQFEWDWLQDNDLAYQVSTIPNYEQYSRNIHVNLRAIQQVPVNNVPNCLKLDYRHLKIADKALNTMDSLGIYVVITVILLALAGCLSFSKNPTTMAIGLVPIIIAIVLMLVLSINAESSEQDLMTVQSTFDSIKTYDCFRHQQPRQIIDDYLLAPKMLKYMFELCHYIKPVLAVGGAVVLLMNIILCFA